MSKYNYIASVITPFHNTNFNYFEPAFESVVNQTVGVENIEWIIVVHNSEDGYYQKVKEMAKPYDSIKVYELKNDIRTASSPRNYAMDRATGKYIFFLDSDDRFTLNCIKDVTEKMDEYNAVFAKIRSTKIMEEEGLVGFVDHRARFDQTVDAIVMKKGDPDMKNIISFGYMTPWSQVFLREFLDEHNLRYDLNRAIGEDMDFTFKAMKYADSILVLPQTIGYVYYVNHESTLQTIGELSPEVIFKMVDNGVEIISSGIDVGLDVRYLFWIIMSDVAGMMMACPGITDEHKKIIHEKLGPFIEKIEPLDGDGKFYTEEQAQDTMNLVKSVIGIKQDDTVGGIEEVNLLSILHDNAKTDIGKRYGFNLIHNVKAFESKVPISDYSFYEPLVNLTTQVGEEKIFCEAPVMGYAVSSGTKGRLKKTPFTEKDIKSFVIALGMVNGGQKGSTFLMFPCLPKDFKNMDNTYNNHIFGAALQGIKTDINDNSHEKKDNDGYLTSPNELLFPDETFNPRHARLLFALLDKNVARIVSPFTWTLLETFEYLEKNYKIIIEDIRTGRIHTDDVISEDMKKKLESRLHASPERADELERIFSEGFDEPVIPKIWPDMERIVSVGTGGFTIYRDRLRRYAGDDIDFHNGLYATSEGIVGISYGVGDDRYKLYNGNNYFEFLPEGETTADSILQPKELAPGHNYEVVLTNHSGLYRYRLGDIIHVESLEEGVPVFTYLRRTDQVCELAGERIYNQDIYNAVKSAGEQSGVDIADFAYGLNESGSGVCVWLEPASTNDHYEKAIASKNDLAETVEKALAEASPAYKKIRMEKNANKVTVYILEPETQILKRDRDMYKLNIMPDQMKPVRVIDDEKTRAFFMKFSS